MSAVLDFLDDIGLGFVGSVIDTLAGVLAGVGQWAWDNILEPALEFVFGLFGIKDEDLIGTNVSVQRIIKDDEAIAAIMTKVCLEKQKDDSIGIMDRFLAHTQRVKARYNAYFRYGKNDFTHGLPEANLKAIRLDTGLLKTVIDGIYSIDCTILESKVKAPDKYEYVYAKFHDLYGYKPYNNELVYLGDTYKITNIDYNYGLDRYDVYITSYENRTTVVTTTTVVTITNIDATNDNKNTTVTERTVVTGTKSGVISDVTVELSNVNATIPKGSETGSTNSGVNTSIVNDVVYATASIAVAAFNPTRHYIVKYWYVNASEWYYWVYEENSGAYPTLDNTNYRTTNLDMLPIVALRNATINVNADKESAAYKQAKEILNYIGLDVDQLIDGISENDQIANVEDAFVHFGINPNDQDPVISKMLYEIFEYSYSDAGLGGVNGSAKGFTATIQEGPFNAAIAWASQSRVINDGIIGPLGSYKHSIVDKSLIVQKQEEPEKYVTITMNNMSSITLIDRQGLVGTTTSDVGHENFYIPLSIFLVNKLSPIEQTILFNKSLILTIYAAQVQHLEWYETEAFGDFLQIVAIVIFIYTWNPAAFSISTALIAVGKYLIVMLILEAVMKATDSPLIRALAIVAAAYVMGGGFDTVNFEFVNPMVLTDSVTNFCTALTTVTSGLGMAISADMAELRVQQQQFQSKVEAVQAEQEAAKEELYTPFDATYLSNLKQVEQVSPYLYGVDAMIYKSRDIQYNFNSLYDYNRLTSDFVSNKLRLGIV